MVVDCGPFVVVKPWPCGIESRSVLGTISVAV
jgi:hypothetical protein